jgi:hypothetical protein
MATEVPVLVEIDQLAERFRPQAADPDFEGAWSKGAPLHSDDLSASWLPEQSDVAEQSTESESGVADDVDDDDRPPF